MDCKPVHRSLPFSNHILLPFHVNLSFSRFNLPHTITFLKTKDINLDNLSALINTLPKPDSLSTPNELISHYYSNPRNLLLFLTPLKPRSISFSVSAHQFTPNIRRLKAKECQLERLQKNWSHYLQGHVFKPCPSLQRLHLQDQSRIVLVFSKFL